MTGEYGRFQVLNWATKFYVDALLRDELRDTPGADRGPHEGLRLSQCTRTG